MARGNLRIRVDDDGQLEVVDPCFDTLDLLQEIEPSFNVRRAPLQSFAEPRFLKTRNVGSGLDELHLPDCDEPTLWAQHDEVIAAGQAARALPAPALGEATLLDLKVELAFRLLADCRLCARRCGVDRSRDKLGTCGLGTEAVVAEHFVHIAEEAPINPSVVISLAGCGLRCRFCQQWPLLTPSRVEGRPLDDRLWARLEPQNARSLSFVGGNPDESIYAILKFLRAAPEWWTLPIVWNSHAYSTSEAMKLLDGVVDVYLPDFKYGNDMCGRRVSGISNYPATAEASVAAMVAQAVPVIVRILVLPGHNVCCHSPALARLAAIGNEQLFVSIRGQYCPDWMIKDNDGDLARRPTSGEIEAVRNLARQLELQLID